MTVITSHFDVFWSGIVITLKLVAISASCSLLAGILLAGLRISPVPSFRKAGTIYVEIVRNTPLTIVFFFSAFVLPQLGVSLSYFTFAAIALTVYYAAFNCEAIRAGFNAVPFGQAEAARAIGLGFFGSLKEIVLPQAIRNVIPPLVNVFISLIKSTAVASAFGVAELLTMMEHLVNTESDAVLPIMATTAALYLAITLPAGVISRALERKVVIHK